MPVLDLVLAQYRWELVCKGAMSGLGPMRRVELTHLWVMEHLAHLGPLETTFSPPVHRVCFTPTQTKVGLSRSVLGVSVA